MLTILADVPLTARRFEVRRERKKTAESGGQSGRERREKSEDSSCRSLGRRGTYGRQTWAGVCGERIR